MATVLWILQAVLAAVFFAAGMMKLTQPQDKLAKRFGWAEDYSSATVKFFGFLEVIGAIGVIVPYAVGILPILTPFAATALSMVMAGAAVVHLRREEMGMVLLNIFFMFVAAGVGFGRLLEVLEVQL